MAAPNGAGAESQPIMSLREPPTPPAMGLPLSAFLDALTDPAVRSIMSALASATAEVAALAREGGTEAAGGSNTFGDEQLAIDLAAEAAILRILRTVPAVATVASEENPADQTVHADGTHSVAFDPLDGSSVVASNWAVGSIFGVYEGKNLEGAEGRSLVAALLSVYGPRTTVWAAGSGAPGAWEFTLRAGTWTLSGFCGSMDAPVRVFAPANLRAAHGNPKLEAALAHYRRERYTLRYSGALVPDVAMMLTRRGGIYFSPVAEGAPAKLRLLFELQPVAYVVEAAGGAAVTDEGRFVMEMPVEASDQRAGVVLGSTGEVKTFLDMVGLSAD